MEPTDHSSNCVFCMKDPSKRPAGKNALAIIYADLLSSIAQVSHCPDLHVPTSPKRKRLSSEEDEVIDADYRGADEERNPYSHKQKELNDLIGDLGLTKSNAELLMSGLKQ